MKPIGFHPEARLEADAAAAYYFRDNAEASRGFLDELENSVSEIEQAPRRWPFETGTNAQRRQMKRFPFTIFYLDDPHEVYVLAVAHTSRRPGYWKTRIAVD